MTAVYDENARIEEKVAGEARCLSNTFEKIALSMRTPYIDTKLSEEFLEELRRTRCVWERILRVFDENLFTDYQMEKFSTPPFRGMKNESNSSSICTG